MHSNLLTYACAGATICWTFTVLLYVQILAILLFLHISISKLSVDPDSGYCIIVSSHIIMNNSDPLCICCDSAAVLFRHKNTHPSSPFSFKVAFQTAQKLTAGSLFLNWCFDSVLFYYLYNLVSCLPSFSKYAATRVVYSDRGSPAYCQSNCRSIINE